MSDNDILNEQPTPAPLQFEPIDDQKDYLSELVGEDKRYKTPAELARAALHKDQHIARLEHENRMIRDDLEKRVNLQEVVDRLSQVQEARAQPDHRPPVADPNLTPATPPTPDFDEIINQKLTEHQEKERRTNNARKVNEELSKRFGANFKTVVAQRAAELGLGPQFVNDLAQTQPEAMLALFPGRQVDQSAMQMAAPENRMNAAGAAPSGTPGKKFKDYQKLYKENPGEYWTPRVQNEIAAEALRQGSSFYE